jgi:tetratricopeptide (TPR) repeat protein
MQFSLSRCLSHCPPVVLLTTLAFSPALNAQVLTVPTQTAKPPAQQQPPDPDAGIDPQAQAKVVADLQARNFSDALAGAKAILSANPNSPKANKLVGVVLLDQQKSSDALPYFQKALQLSPGDPTINALLLQVYAQTGDKTHRDEQRTILRGYHSDGKHPAFAQTPAYLIETIPVSDKTIQAIEFYEPAGQFHFYYRFNIFDSAGKIQSFIALESDDADQAMYAQQHPKEAAAGERRFSLDGYSQSADGHVSQALYTFFNGQPSYDDVRALVIKLVQEGKAPALATTTTSTK